MSQEQSALIKTRDDNRDPLQVEWKSGIYLFQNADTNERISAEHVIVSVLWIYPFKGHTDGVPTANADANGVRIGVKTSGALVLPDTIVPGDVPLKFTATVGKDGTQKHLDVHDIFGRCGTAGDGVFWIGHE